MDDDDDPPPPLAESSDEEVAAAPSAESQDQQDREDTAIPTRDGSEADFWGTDKGGVLNEALKKCRPREQPQQKKKKRRKDKAAYQRYFVGFMATDTPPGVRGTWEFPRTRGTKEDYKTP